MTAGVGRVTMLRGQLRRYFTASALLSAVALVTVCFPLPADARASALEDVKSECSTAFLPMIAAEGPALAPCQGVRPGGALILKSGDLDLVYCTMAFLITDGKDVYLTTAGHCTLEELGAPSLGEDTYAHGVEGPIGKVAYTWCEGQAANGGCGGGTDFGMIRLNANGIKHATPAMCDWGRPSGLFGAFDDVVRELRHTGWGSGVGGLGVGTRINGELVQPANPATQSRHSFGVDFSDPTMVLGWGASIPGDSGSGVMVTDLPALPSTAQATPKALGVLTHISAAGLLIVQRLDASLAKAGKDMHRTFTLWKGRRAG